MPESLALAQLKGPLEHGAQLDHHRLGILVVDGRAAVGCGLEEPGLHGLRLGKSELERHRVIHALWETIGHLDGHVAPIDR